ncbi:MAG: hypothetical protein ACTSRX_01935 [Promethearchaeota archaeon]
MAKKKTTKKKVTKKKVTKKKTSKPKPKKVEEEDFDDEEGPEFIEEDLEAMDDDMLTGEDEGIQKRTPDAIELMLRDVECSSCEGSSTKDNCKVRDDYRCPPEKADL